MSLNEALLIERQSSYARLRGGYSVPLAGTTYWIGLGVWGYAATPSSWALTAFITSGAIFPLALMFAKLLRNDFMAERTAVTSVLAPTFIAMLLYLPMAISAYYVDPQLAPLMIGIGMSLHWPVIGWSYGRTSVFTAHTLVRAAVVTAMWWAAPDLRFTALPFAIAAIYAVTVVVILLDSARFRQRYADQI